MNQENNRDSSHQEATSLDVPLKPYFPEKFWVALMQHFSGFPHVPKILALGSKRDLAWRAEFEKLVTEDGWDVEEVQDLFKWLCVSDHEQAVFGRERFRGIMGMRKKLFKKGYSLIKDIREDWLDTFGERYSYQEHKKRINRIRSNEFWKVLERCGHTKAEVVAPHVMDTEFNKSVLMRVEEHITEEEEDE